MKPELILVNSGWAERMDQLERRCFSSPWSLGMIQEELEHPRCLVMGIADGDRLWGYLALSWVLDEGSIDNIAVDPDLRRRGLGSRLMKAALEEAERRSLTSVTLEVRAGNLAAQALYEKYGFRPVGRRARYYTAPEEDAILMTRMMACEDLGH